MKTECESKITIIEDHEDEQNMRFNVAGPQGGAKVL